MKWTEEQARAIYSSDRKILVAAAAGSGKTAVLSERILTYLREGGEVTQLLVVTFTNAAAEEMKGRIRKKIQAEIQSETGNLQFWKRQIEQLEWASIQTFHSFCKKIIDQNLFLLPYDKGYRLIQNQERIRLRKEVIRQVLEQYYQSEDPSIQGIFKQFRTAKSDENLLDILERVMTFLRSQPERIHASLGEEEWDSILKGEMAIAFRSLEFVLQDLETVCELPGGPIKYKAALESDRQLIAILLRFLEEKDEGCFTQAKEWKFTRFQAIRKEEKAQLDEQLIDRVKKMRSFSKKLMKKWLDEFLIPVSNWSLNTTMAAQAKALMTLGRAADYAIKMRKIQEGVMDFDDLETYAYELLQQPKVAHRYRKRYAQIYVDEYQDTSHMQEAVLMKINHGNQLFFVGDGKQSIYQFRGATPELFLSKIREEDQGFSVIRLNQNFRSNARVIDGINAFFNRCMKVEFGGVNYQKTDQLQIGQIKTGVEKPKFVVVKDERGIAAEIDWIADQIQLLLDQGNPPDQIAVLARSLASVQDEFQQVFQKRGIPFQTNTQSNAMNAVEIRMYQSLLFYINGAISDTVLLAVMRLPIWGFSADELATIRGSQPQGRFELACRAYSKENHNSLGKKIQGFYRRITEIRARARLIPLADFLEELLEMDGLIGQISSLPGGFQREHGLKSYVMSLKARVHGNCATLHQLCRVIEEEQREGIAMSLPIPQTEQGVRLMTIHASKGLEFETVFIANASQSVNLRELYEPVQIHDEFGLAMACYHHKEKALDIPLEMKIAKERIRRQRVSEELRIFYVGMTRAVERLIVVSHDRFPARTREKQSYYATIYGGIESPSLYHWMVGAKIYSHPDWTYEEVEFLDGVAQVDAEDKLFLEKPQEQALAETDETAYSVKTHKKRKVNLTGWIRRGEEKQIVFEEKTKWIELGIAFHEVLEKLPLIQFISKEDALEALEKLQISRRITQETRQRVDEDLLWKWTQSDLGCRILQSKRVFREKSFVATLPDNDDALYAQGKLDCLFFEEDGWVLVDYKYRIHESHDLAVCQIHAYQEMLSICFNIHVKSAYLYEWVSGEAIEINLV
ncbi:helicase-exonuclease AddAB subunit AddA [Gottschalkiaceae bacterium SANA]|nr:helicase-exonuclease AddAB subunit AddA [Gottschalkiaceae bacterium SANA]